MLVLRPSTINGVGLFTTKPIAKGEQLRLWPEGDLRFLTDAEAAADPEFAELGEIFCVRDAGGWWCPNDFHRMSIGFYINHSDDPNVHTKKEWDYEYFALRDIAADEEILCDYTKITPYETKPTGALRP
jgi:SET domain-containing protein